MEVLEFVAQVNDTLPRALLWQEMRPCKKRRKCPVLCGGPEAAAGDDVTSASVRASERASSSSRACAMAEASISASANASARARARALPE